MRLIGIVCQPDCSICLEGGITESIPEMEDVGISTNVSAAIAQEVLLQLQRRNKLSLGFKDIIKDYQLVLQQSKEQAV